MRKTVVILGAGASADYGYPLWGQLKHQVLDLNIRDFLGKEVQLKSRPDFDSHVSVYEEFCNFATRNNEDTLDQIIYKIDQPKEKHLKPTGHLLINIAGFILAKIELNKRDGGWVTKLQDIFIEYLIAETDLSSPDRNLFANLTIVSLNYDRVFEHFISRNFYQKMIEHASYSIPAAGIATTFSRGNKLDVLKPHGYICGLGNQNNVSHVGMNPDLVLSNAVTSGTRYPGNNRTIAYGDSKITEHDSFLRMGRHMYVVDERGNNDYRSTNDSLANAEVVFCLGLSDAGICQSSLEFLTNQRIYLSNKEEDIAKIEKVKPGPEYVSLGAAGARMNATDFPDRFKSICL